VGLGGTPVRHRRTGVPILSRLGAAEAPLHDCRQVLGRRRPRRPESLDTT